MKNRRFRYLKITSIVFIIGFILYGILGVVAVFNNFDWLGINNDFLKVIMIALFGGYFFFSIVSGVLFVSQFISHQSEKTKILMGVLFIVPVLIAMCAVFYSIPYAIYNYREYKKISF